MDGRGHHKKPTLATSVGFFMAACRHTNVSDRLHLLLIGIPLHGDMRNAILQIDIPHRCESVAVIEALQMGLRGKRCISAGPERFDSHQCSTQQVMAETVAAVVGIDDHATDGNGFITRRCCVEA